MPQLSQAIMTQGCFAVRAAAIFGQIEAPHRRERVAFGLVLALKALEEVVELGLSVKAVFVCHSSMVSTSRRYRRRGERGQVVYWQKMD